jgi:rRNA pseudouridine-1189 N-methylase Emg1 (Nep1/Mra1 family)
MGREKRARLKKVVGETSEELVVAHITTKRPIREEAKRYNKQRMQDLLLRQNNRHDHVNACMAW